MQQAGHAERYFRDVSQILPVGTISISPRPTVPTNPLSYARDGRRQGRGGPGPLTSLGSRSLTCGNTPRKLLILSFIYSVERVDKASAGYRCAGVGLMFSSIQAMNTTGLCCSGQTVMPRPP